MALLDQKPAGFRIQIVADELEFRLGQTQSIDIVRFAAVGVGKQYLGRNLLHDAVRNVRTQRIRRALRAEDKKGILLAELGRASCRVRVCQYGEISVVAGA